MASRAVAAADRGSQAWRTAVHTQQNARPDHLDLYDLAGELVYTLDVLDSMVALLVRQAGHYAQHADLSDDEGAGPAGRLRLAGRDLARARPGIATARAAVNAFWSAVGHIGREDRS